MNLTYGVARALYRKKEHPRLLLGPAELALLKAQIRAGAGKKIWAALRLKAAALFAELAAVPDLKAMLAGDGSWQSLSSRLLFSAEDLAIVALLDERADYIELLRTVMRTVCEVDAQKSRTALRVADLAGVYDLLESRWRPEDRAAFVQAALATIRARLEPNRIAYFKSAGGNIMLMNVLMALPCALVVKGEPGADAELDGLLRELILCFESSVHVTANENGYPEEDGGYGTLILGRLAVFGEMLHRAGLFNVYRASPAFARSGQALLHFVQPWGQDLSNTGDHGDDFGSRELVLARLAARTKDPALVWLYRTLHYTRGVLKPLQTIPGVHVEVPLAPGEQVPASFRTLLTLDVLGRGRPPALTKPPTAFCDRQRGIVSFRSGWGAEDTLVVFDGSQRSTSAQGHAHASGGHFSLSAAGEYFSIDTGRYNVDQANHSVVLVNGKAGRPQHPGWESTKYPGRLIACEPGALVDYAAVDSSHQHNIYWAKRHLGLVKGARSYVWIVDDLNCCDDWAEYTWQMQVCPENVIEVHGAGATITGWRHGNKLDVHFALPAPEEYVKPHTLAVSQDEAGTGSWQYMGVPEEMAARVAGLKAGVVKGFARPADMVHGPVYVRPRLLGKVAGYNGRFMTLLIPRMKGEKPARVERLKSLPNVLAAKIVFPDGTEDRVVFAYEHRLLVAEGVDKRGAWAVIRKNKGGRTQEHVSTRED